MSSDISGQSQEATVYSTVGPSVSRRRFLRAGAAAAGASAIGVGAMRSDAVGTAQASFFEDATEWMIDNVATVGASYWLAGEIHGQFFDDEDLSGYIGSENLWARIEEKALELQAHFEQVINGVENTIDYADRIALHEGMQAVLVALENNESQTDQQEAMETAIDDYFGSIQAEMVVTWDYLQHRKNSWWESVNQFEPESGDLDLQPNQIMGNETGSLEWSNTTSTSDLFAADADYDDDSNWEEILLFDGSTKDVYRPAEYYYPFDNEDDLEDQRRIAVISVDGYDHYDNNPGDTFSDYTDVNGTEDLIKLNHGERLKAIWEQLADIRDSVYGELSQFVSEVNAEFDPEDIDTSDMLTPLDFYDSASEEDDSAFVDAALRSLGLPRSNETVTVEFHETDVELDGALYLLDDDPATLQVGQQYDPDEEDETADSYISDSPVYFSYADFVEDDDTGELEEVAEVITVEEPFTVTEARDADGETIDSVDFDEGPTYDPSDIEGLIEQLEQQNQLLIEMQQEADSGGGGGWFGDGGGGGIVAVAIGVLALIIAVFNSNN